MAGKKGELAKSILEISGVLIDRLPIVPVLVLAVTMQDQNVLEADDNVLFLCRRA